MKKHVYPILTFISGSVAAACIIKFSLPFHGDKKTYADGYAEGLNYAIEAIEEGNIYRAPATITGDMTGGHILVVNYVRPGPSINFLPPGKIKDVNIKHEGDF